MPQDRRKIPVSNKNLTGRAKGHSQFLEALKLYESRQYKKSLKTLDAILKKDPLNVDALALKGLNFLLMGDKKDAENYVMNAISKISHLGASAVCCHVLGIYMRSTKNYADAVKWFQASLDNGSANQQIYRDLATLQSQIGDFKGALSSRKIYWESFMGYRSNWTALAVAQDINGESEQAISTLSQFEKLVEGKLGEPELYEHSECLMYKNDIMFRAAENNDDKLRDVLNHLNEVEKDIFDKHSVLHRKASIYHKLGDRKAASKYIRMLIQRNPDDFHLYKRLEEVLGIENDSEKREILYANLEKFYPRSDPPKFIPLTFLDDTKKLESKFADYVISQLKRGVPATFGNIKPLYKSRSKLIIPISNKVVNEFVQEVDPYKDPLSFVWACYYLAQHYLFLNDFSSAQVFIDKAIDSTPTLVEFYILKGRILKAIGKFNEAAEWLEEGRKLDLQDRFINTKTVKYLLRANNIDGAVEIVSLFTKNDDSVNGVKDLHLVEASWFIVEQAEAYYRLFLETKKKLHEELSAEKTYEASKNGDIESQLKELKKLEWSTRKYQGLSLKRFQAIAKMYRQFEDDQLDFHSYCMRKGTPRAYLEMLDWGRKIYENPMYVRSMEGASKILFQLHDEPSERKKEFDGIFNRIMKENAKKSKKINSQLNKLKDEERKACLAHPESEDKDVFGLELISSCKDPLELFWNEFYRDYSSKSSEESRDYVLEFEYQYGVGKLALCLAALKKYSKYHGEKSGLAGAMAITLLLATRETEPFERIAQQVAFKGCQAIRDLPVDERDNEAFDWCSFFTQHYLQDLPSLLFLYKHEPRQNPDYKALILDQIKIARPQQQIDVLQYHLSL